MAARDVTAAGHGKGGGRSKAQDSSRVITYTAVFVPSSSKSQHRASPASNMEARVCFMSSHQLLYLNGSFPLPQLQLLAPIPIVAPCLLRKGLCHQDGVVVCCHWPHCLLGTSHPCQWL